MLKLDLSDLPDVVAELGPDRQDVIARAITRERRNLRENPLTYGYPPHAVQERVLCSNHRITLLIAGNRLGKSEIAMREVLWRARGDHPYKKVKLAKQIWIGIPSFNFFEETTRPHFDKWCPPGWRAGEWNESKLYIDIIRIDGKRCRIWVKTYEQGRDKWQGAGVDFIHIDEECPEEIYKEARARLVDTRGQMLMTLTPVSGMGWIYDRLYVPGLNERRKTINVIEGALAEYDESKPFCVGKVLVPHLSYQDVLEFAEEYPDPDELAIRVFGQFRKRAGLIYKSFDVRTHVIQAFEIPETWTVWGGIDPGFHGFAFTLWAMDPSGRMYAIAEAYSTAQSYKERLTAIADHVLKARPWLLDAYHDDPDSVEPIVVFVDTEDPQTVLELNIESVERKLPLVFASLEQGLKARKAGILRCQQLLACSQSRETPQWVKRAGGRPKAGEPMLYVLDTLYSEWRVGEKPMTGSRLAWELARYSWKKAKKDQLSQPDEPDKESAAGAHVLDTMRYAVMARLGAPEEPKEKRHPDDGLTQLERDVWEDVRRLEESMEAGSYDDG